MNTVCAKPLTIVINNAALPKPTAYWELEEASGTRVDAVGTVANNLTPFGNDVGNDPGIITNGLYIAGDPNPDYRTTSGTTLQYNVLSAGITLSFWIKFKSAFGNKFRAYLSAWDIAFLTDCSMTNTVFEFQPASGPNVTANLAQALVVGQWYFAVGQYLTSTGKTRISLNAGPWTDSPTSASAAGATTTPAQFFVTPIGGPDCVIDEMGIWLNQLLSASDITALYNAGAAQRPPFV